MECSDKKWPSSMSFRLNVLSHIEHSKGRSVEWMIIWLVRCEVLRHEYPDKIKLFLKFSKPTWKTFSLTTWIANVFAQVFHMNLSVYVQVSRRFERLRTVFAAKVSQTSVAQFMFAQTEKGLEWFVAHIASVIKKSFKVNSNGTNLACLVDFTGIWTNGPLSKYDV